MRDVYEGMCSRDVYEICVRRICTRNVNAGCV